MKIQIEQFFRWHEKNMVTHYKSNVTFEYHKTLFKEFIICKYCKKQFIPKIKFEPGYQKYCSYNCRIKSYSNIYKKNKK
jgi:hypothetical protein